MVGLFGWHFDIPSPGERPELNHCVIIEAPHTSIYDYLVGAACVWKLQLNARFFIKKEFFVFPLRRFLRRYGAVPIDRGNRNNNIVDKAVDEFNRQENITFIITPEGTRKKVSRFKRGFYDIAVQAKVPIVLSYINYSTHHMGIGPTVYPSGNFNEDMLQIAEFYTDAQPRNKEGWSIDLIKQTYKAKTTETKDK